MGRQAQKQHVLGTCVICIEELYVCPKNTCSGRSGPRTACIMIAAAASRSGRASIRRLGRNRRRRAEALLGRQPWGRWRPARLWRPRCHLCSSSLTVVRHGCGRTAPFGPVIAALLLRAARHGDPPRQQVDGEAMTGLDLHTISSIHERSAVHGSRMHLRAMRHG